MADLQPEQRPWSRIQERTGTFSYQRTVRPHEVQCERPRHGDSSRGSR